jgi:hypothetical protein
MKRNTFCCFYFCVKTALLHVFLHNFVRNSGILSLEKYFKNQSITLYMSADGFFLNNVTFLQRKFNIKSLPAAVNILANVISENLFQLLPV